MFAFFSTDLFNPPQIDMCKPHVNKMFYSSRKVKLAQIFYYFNILFA